MLSLICLLINYAKKQGYSFQLRDIANVFCMFLLAADLGWK